MAGRNAGAETGQRRAQVAREEVRGIRDDHKAKVKQPSGRLYLIPVLLCAALPPALSGCRREACSPSPALLPFSPRINAPARRKLFVIGSGAGQNRNLMAFGVSVWI